MKNTKLTRLLITFSKFEIIKFSEFVNSPYFNKNKNVINLCGAVLNFYPGFDSKNYTGENIYDKLFPGGKYDYFKLKNIISDLFSLALLYLRISGSEKKGIDNEITLLNILHERNLDKIYSSREQKISALLKNSPVKDEDNFLRQYQLERINTAHYKFKGSAYEFNQIQTEFDSFHKYALTGLLRLYSKMLHNKNHGNINFNMEMFDKLWEYVKHKDFQGNPSCMIYKQTISLELTKNEEEYRKLLHLKKIYNSQIPDEDMYYILQFINSFSVYRLKLGDESYYTDRFNSFREMLERGFIAANNFLFPNFISTFVSACMANQYSWAAAFMKQYQNGITPHEEKSNAINYCKAFMAYRQKQFDKALAYFSKTNFRLYLIKVMVKSYTVRIYYEQDLPEQLYLAIDAFRHYLKSEKLMSSEQKSAHFEFLVCLGRLADLKPERTNKIKKQNLELLKERVLKIKSNPLGAKNWLLEKISEIL